MLYLTNHAVSLQVAGTNSPYCAWRIAIILSSAGLHDEERAFLAAWCRHFAVRGTGSRYADLVARAVKKGFYPERLVVQVDEG
jgi:hypothetical protein